MNPVLNWLMMGGYFSYIWSAYAVVGGVFFFTIIRLRLYKQKSHKKLHLWFKKQP
jgi:heme exporter protein CcmD